MRSSKNRSRSKANRPRTLGNIVNRVFDSSGPEGKVRGTPQQIIEKYLVLARDAQLSNDRVAAENFQQHAEHYTRMLAEAQRELAAEQEARQQGQGGGQGAGQGGGGRRDDRDGWQGGNGGGGQWQGGDRDRERRPEFRGEGGPRGESRGGDAPRGVADVIDLSDGEGHLVETPEARAARRDFHDQPARGQEPRRDARRDDRRRDGDQGAAARQAEARPAEARPAETRPAEARAAEAGSDRARADEPRHDDPHPAAAAASEVPVAGPDAAAEGRSNPRGRRPRGPRKGSGDTPPPADPGPREAAE